jgi:hypothetical protein
MSNKLQTSDHVPVLSKFIQNLGAHFIDISLSRVSNIPNNIGLVAKYHLNSKKSEDCYSPYSCDPRG